MAYIGKEPIIGNFVKLDAITAVNGQAAYTMQNGGSNFTDYSTVNQFMVSLNGTIQSPGSSFTVSGSTLTFASNLSTGDVIDFIMVFGNSLSAGTPTDGTVTNAKINYPLAESGATVSTFNRTSSDGKILELQKDGSAVGNISSHSSGGIRVESEHSLELKSSATNGLRLDDAGIFRPQTDNVTDVGKSSNRFKDLYLSGNIYLGGTGSANALDDYEEGTWTPGFTNFSGSGGESGPTSPEGYYTKIGDLVFASFYVAVPANGDSSAINISSLPFSAKDVPTMQFGGSITRTDAAFSVSLATVVSDNSNYIHVTRSTSSANLVPYQDVTGKFLTGIVVYKTA